MAIEENAIRELVGALSPGDAGQKSNTYSAIVSHIDNEGTVWVILAGSDKETPTASTSTEVKRGDSVTVQWRNNKLYIGGNYSNPSVGFATVMPSVDFVTELVDKDITVNSINAATGYIGDLTSKNITTDNITAATGYIGDLTADHVSASDISASTGFIGDLTAGGITAQNIVADHATVGSLDANYAKIADLDAAKGRIDDLEANEVVVNDTLKAANAEIEYLSSDWISTDRLVLTGNNKNNYPPVQITETEFNANKTAYWTKSGNTYTQCTQQSVYDPDEQYYVRQTVQSIIEAINTANNTDPQVVVSNDKLIAASMDVAELSAITADMGTLTAGKIQKGNNFINLNTSPASMEFKNASTWDSATQGIRWTTQGKLDIKGAVTVTAGSNVPTTDDMNDAIDGIEIGGRNLLIDTDAPSVTKVHASANRYISNISAAGYTATFEEMSDLPTNNKYALRISQTSNFNYDHFLTFYSGQGVPLIRGDEYTMSVWCKRVSGSNLKLSLQLGVTSYIASGDLPVPADNDWHRYTWTFTAPSGDNYYYADTSSSRAYVGSIRNVTSAYEALFCGWKLEKGNKATDWTLAPEDVQGEIDAKKSVHTLNTSYSYTYANILTYSAEGFNSDWNVTSTDGVKAGDTARLKVTVSNMSNAPVYIIGTVTEVKSATKINMTSHGLDTTIIDGGNILTNSIGANQIASNAITINKMDSTTQSQVLNSNIQIGGRNLFRNTALLGITSLPTNNADTTFVKDYVRGYNAPSAWSITKFDDGINQIEITLNNTSNLGICFARLATEIDLDPNSDYTMSCWAKCTVSGAKLSMGLSYYKTSNEWVWRVGTNLQNFNSTSAWQRFTLTFKPDSDTKGLNYCFTCNNGTSGGTGKLYIRQCKLEKGNKPTEWSPAPEDVQESINAVDNNILVDADAPTTTRVNGEADRYWSDGGNTQITCSNFVLTDAPEQGLLYGRRFVCSGTQTSAISRGYAFYNTNDNVIPLVPNKTYTVTWWARCTSGSGQTWLIWSKGDGATSLSSSPKYALSRYWKKFTVSFTFGSAVNTNYNRIWFDTYFPASTAGTVEICGCKLVAGGEAEAYITRIDDTGIKIHPADASGNDSLQINSTAIDFYRNNVSMVNMNDTDIRVGKLADDHVRINSSGMTVYTGDESTASNNVAFFGADSRIGNASGRRVQTYAGGIQVYNENNELRSQFGSDWMMLGKSDGSRVTIGTGTDPYIYMNANGVNAFRADSTGVRVGNYGTDYAYLKSDGLHVYQASTEVASFGGTARVGLENSSHLQITENSISGIASNGNEYFAITENGGTTTDWIYTSSFNSGYSGDSATFDLSSVASSDWSAVASGASFRIKTEFYAKKSGYGTKRYSTVVETFTKGTSKNNTYATYTQPNTVKSTTSKPTVPSGYTFLGRKLYLGRSASTVMPFYRIGRDTAESGGSASCVMGTGTVAASSNQLAIGKYNANDSSAVLMVGNGTSTSARKNVFTVSTAGVVTAEVLNVSGTISTDSNINANGICVNSHSSWIGDIKSAYLTANKAITAGTAASLCSIALTAGVWVIVAVAQFPNGSDTTYRRLKISTSSTSAEPPDVQISAHNGHPTTIQSTKIVSISANTTYYLTVMSAKAQTLLAGSVDGFNYIKAVRIV